MSLIGCGKPTCISKTKLSFCSRACRNKAFRERLIDYDDINEKNSLSITKEAHERSFSIGCGDGCVSKENMSFCSRSCKNAAFSCGLIKNTDINNEISNLQLTTQAHKKLFF